MRHLIAAACLFATNVRTTGATALDLGGVDQLSDPDMRGEVKKVEDSNLAAALARGAVDARRSAQYLLVLLDYARDQVVGATAELKAARAKDLEEQEDALALAGQMLDIKGRDFREKAAAARVALPELDAAELMTLRAAYRARDRQRDLRRAEIELTKAQESPRGKKARISSEEQTALGALSECLTELKAARVALEEGAKRLANRTLPRRKLEARSEQLDSDISDLAREARLLDIALLMQRIDQENF